MITQSNFLLVMFNHHEISLKKLYHPIAIILVLKLLTVNLF
ncbi:hypothetical protein APHACPA_1607 [Rickettsia amblyommatis str. Ac/Pa]|uniref:Uncharacterized protein n=1 Tax=Rickettsia amblyommatis str. Ac/Pa TaxID=1359164 RepID=A0A0F3N4D0_RICAM|nr:hypothetical protein APHACPA_1607 [Rickettsia amblyommatis str. Ac/Pa]